MSGIPTSDFRLPTSGRFSLPTSDFRLPSSKFYFRLPSSDFRVQKFTSDFRLPTSEFEVLLPTSFHYQLPQKIVRKNSRKTLRTIFNF
ncbi:hypothetical protein B9Z55_005873 [Caenorhabditis nigoni]|uniref:Uncharacterized protein n=1 Tax=Caenorhabditis nigoni TaxID=1611254 RepID=A0A2G5V2Q7_9PELO|nr:hypothetical protein B9Z55_005873 [Caenorhabditis nigoni]